MRRELGAVINRLMRGLDFSRHSEWISSVLIASVTREIAAGDIDADSVSSLEDVARLPQTDVVFVDLARFNERRVFQRLAESCPADALTDGNRSAIRVDITKSRREVSIYRA